MRPSATVTLSALVLGLVGVTQWTTQWVNNDLLTETVRQREIDKISTLGNILNSLITQRDQETQTLCKLLASDHTLAQALRLGEPARSQQLAQRLDEVYQLGRTQVLEVTDDQETIVFKAQDHSSTGTQASGWGVAEALGGKGILVSTRDADGVVVRAIEPLRSGAKMLGTLSCGFALNPTFFHKLGMEVDAKLLLLGRKGAVDTSGQSSVAQFESIAMDEAFEKKIPVYRFDEARHLTSVYLPVFIVDEAYVILAEIDSSSAYALIANGRNRTYSNGIVILLTALIVGLLALRFALSPLRQLRQKAENTAIELTGEAIASSSRDEVTSVVNVLQTLTGRLVLRNSELDQAKVQAEAASVAKSQFLSSMSHEIRTPLNGVLGMAELLQSTPLNEEQQRLVSTIGSAGRALHALLSDILDLAKIEEGQVRIEQLDFDLVRLLTDIAAMYREIAAKRQLNLVLDVREVTTHWVSGDPTRLRQVITNLLGNAMKFTSEGEIRLVAKSISAPQNDAHEETQADTQADPRLWFSVAVQDTGIGMNEQAVGKLFQRFEQADASTTRKYGGSGLGLVICKHLTELMGGHIHASSTQGVGSRFWLELPLAQPSAPQWQAVAVQDVVLPSLAAAKILVAEDNKINQLVITKLIERLGGTVTLVENGELAVEEVKRQAYDMVFMDCQMPVMDGFEATRQIRQWEDQHAVAKALPIVALTANALASDRDECIAAGMTDFASKPINGETLKKVLYRHLNLAPDGQTLA